MDCTCVWRTAWVVPVALAALMVLAAVVSAPCSARRRPGHATAVTSDGRANRPDRLLGIVRHGRLAVAHGDAPERQLPQRHVERSGAGRSPMRGTLPSDEATGSECKSYGAAAVMRVPGRLRDHVGQRHHSEDRNRSRHADTLAPFRCLGAACRRADVAGAHGRHMAAPADSSQRRGRTRRARPGGHDLKDRHDATACRLPAQERRSVQCRRRRDGVLQRAFRNRTVTPGSL